MAISERRAPGSYSTLKWFSVARSMSMTLPSSSLVKATLTGHPRLRRAITLTRKSSKERATRQAGHRSGSQTSLTLTEMDAGATATKAKPKAQPSSSSSSSSSTKWRPMRFDLPSCTRKKNMCWGLKLQWASSQFKGVRAPWLLFRFRAHCCVGCRWQFCV